MMNKTIAIALLLLGCLAVFIGGQTAQAARVALVAGTSTMTPSATSGTPAITETQTLTPTVAATTTLVPLPAITLIFPAPTETSTPTVTPLPIAIAQTPEPADGAPLLSLSPRFRVLIGLIILLWLFLVGFAVIYIRQLK